jgi:Predicted metal-dependent phosphoesterases (PHP family)
MKADLHCHSNVSDGLLSPAEVAHRAADRGVELLALTDHDDIAGLREARAAAEARGLRFLDGSEVSVSWRDDASFHVVGLGIDPANGELFAGLKSIRDGRDGRAHRIAAELEKIGIHGAYEGAAHYAEKASIISRAHFASLPRRAGRSRPT